MHDPGPSACGPYRLCPLCEQRAAQVLLYHGWICESCRNEFAARRAAAFILDWVTLVLVGGGIQGLVALSGGPSFEDLPLTFVLCLAFPFKDGLNGMSPGKWLLGVQVVDRMTRRPIGFLASFKRNIVLFIPGLLFLMPIVGLDGTRWGDGWANARAVRRKHTNRYPYYEPTRYCSDCGYDLTGNTSGRCPECGTGIARETRSRLHLAGHGLK